MTHAYAEPGIYELTLAVDDGTGLSNARKQAVLPFRVNHQPRAEAGPDRLVCPGEEVAFDGTGSVDWDGRVTAYHWDFGDGSTAEGARASHRFAAPGLYDVQLAVTDDSGSRCATGTNVARGPGRRHAGARHCRRSDRLRRRCARRAAAGRLRLEAPRRHAPDLPLGAGRRQRARPATRSATPSPSPASIRSALRLATAPALPAARPCTEVQVDVRARE